MGRGVSVNVFVVSFVKAVYEFAVLFLCSNRWVSSY